MYLRLLLTAICVLISAGLAAAYPNAYVANSGTSTVKVIDTSNNSVAATINLPASAYPKSVAVSRSGQYIFVASESAMQIAMIDALTNTVVKTFNVSPFPPGGLAVNPAETRLYVANSTSNSLSVIDIATSSEPARVILDGNVSVTAPQSVVVNAAGDRIYVSNSATNTVSILTADDATNTYAVDATIDVSGGNANAMPMGMALSTDGSKLFVVNYGGSLVVVDTAAKAVTGTPLALESGINAVAVKPDGTRVYVSSTIDKVYAVNTATTTLANTFAVSGGPWGLAIDPAGSKLYAATTYADNVSVVDATSGAVTPTITMGAGSAPISMGNFMGPDMPYTIAASAGANGTISPAGSIRANKYSRTFCFTPNATYHVSSVMVDTDTTDGTGAVSVGAPSCYKVVDAGTGELAHNASISVTFTNSSMFDLTVTLTNPGGTVSSSPVGIPANGGTAAYAPSTPVTLTASPDATHIVGSWGGACSGSGLTCNVTMDATKSVTLTFADRPTTDDFKCLSNGYYYSTFAAAYAAAATNDTMTIVASPVTVQAVDFNLNKNITLNGGYDANHGSAVGMTRFSSLTVTSGSVTVSNVYIQ
jgi:YVTN family beta-propeller protein